MAKELNSECWYREVCQMDNPCDSCIRYSEMKFLMDSSGLPKSKQRPIELIPEQCDYDTFLELQDFKDDIVDNVSHGTNLFIGGPTGNGKTSWAIKILLKYFDSIWAGNGFKTVGVFVHVPTFLLQAKDFNNPLSEEYKRNLLKADIVVWDEIGGVGMSNYDYSQLLMYVDNRVFNDKTNIYTGNLVTEQECVKYMGEKLTSRVWRNSKVCILTGRDRRNG